MFDMVSLLDRCATLWSCDAAISVSKGNRGTSKELEVRGSCSRNAAGLWSRGRDWSVLDAQEAK
jgi:hypothetical protein